MKFENIKSNLESIIQSDEYLSEKSVQSSVDNPHKSMFTAVKQNRLDRIVFSACEYYGRELSCGLATCQACMSNPNVFGTLLKPKHNSFVLLFSAKAYIACRDLINQRQGFDFVVVSFTTLELIKKIDLLSACYILQLTARQKYLPKKLTAYTKLCLRRLDQAKASSLFLFENQFGLDDLALRLDEPEAKHLSVIGQFYSSHTKYAGCGFKIIVFDAQEKVAVLSQDKNDAPVFTIDEYAESLTDDKIAAQLRILSRNSDSVASANEQLIYDRYLDSTTSLLLKQQKQIFEAKYFPVSIFRGKTVIDESRVVWIYGARNCNRALCQSTVYVKLIDPDSAEDEVYRQSVVAEIQNYCDVDHLFSCDISDTKTSLPDDGQTYGRIVHVEPSVNLQVCGCFSLSGDKFKSPVDNFNQKPERKRHKSTDVSHYQHLVCNNLEKMYGRFFSLLDTTDNVPIIPQDEAYPIIMIDKSTLQNFDTVYSENNDYIRLVVVIDSWPAVQLFPQGHWINVIGTVGLMETEIKTLLYDCGLSIRSFSPEALAELPTSDDVIKNCDLSKRADFRLSDCFCDCCTNVYDVSSFTDTDKVLFGTPAFYLTKDPNDFPLAALLSTCSNTEVLSKLKLYRNKHLVFSIDPDTCTDIDDALSVCFTDDPTIVEVGVHIADVSYFIKQNSQLDKEAAERCSTIYLVNKRFDMIPEILSTNLCSLKSGVDRLAFSVIYRINLVTCEIESTSFFKSIIHSIGALTYSQAQRLLDSSFDNPVVDALRVLDKVAKKLKQDRLNAGGIEFTTSSPKFTFSVQKVDENGRVEYAESPSSIEPYKTYSTTSLVEEFMLLANCSVAEKIIKHFPHHSVLRSHKPPHEDHINSLKQALKSINIDLDYSSSKNLARSLAAVKASAPSDLVSLIMQLTIYCMTNAEYVCSGSVKDLTSLRHYALASSLYTHFTSPIRRYADILVHRLLAAAIGYSSLRNLSLRTLTYQCYLMTQTGLSLRKNKRMLDQLLLYKYMSSLNTVKVFSARLNKVESAKLKVYVYEVSSVLDCYFDQSVWRVCENYISNGSRKISLFDLLEVRVFSYEYRGRLGVKAYIVD